MFGSTVLDLAVGLIFTFLVISLITSATTEAFASAMKLRASTLCQGIKDLLNDEQFNGLALSVYNHALVNSQATGVAQSEAALTAKPSYIENCLNMPQALPTSLIQVNRALREWESRREHALPEPRM